MRPSIRPFVCSAALSALAAGPAAADLIIGNLPGNDGTQSASLGGTRLKAMGFTMPRGEDFQLDDVILRLNIGGGTDVVPSVVIHEDAAGVPGNPLVTLDNPPITAIGINNYTFIPPGRFTLEQDTTYWLVVNKASGANSMGWMASSPAQTPTGAATHAGSLWTPSWSSSAIINSYEVNGTRVGAPCYPDCDGNGTLDFFDFLCFQNAFLAQDPYADCDQNGVFDFFDFLCFQNEFLAGCP
jgi:hypothetical protein